LTRNVKTLYITPKHRYCAEYGFFFDNLSALAVITANAAQPIS